MAPFLLRVWRRRLALYIAFVCRCGRVRVCVYKHKTVGGLKHVQRERVYYKQFEVWSCHSRHKQSRERKGVTCLGLCWENAPYSQGAAAGHLHVHRLGQGSAQYQHHVVQTLEGARGAVQQRGHPCPPGRPAHIYSLICAQITKTPTTTARELNTTHVRCANDPPWHAGPCVHSDRVTAVHGPSCILVSTRPA